MKGEAALGKCIICGVVAETEKNFICQDCGDPLKIIFTCTKCHFRMDLTQEDPEKLKNMFGQPLPFGTAIAAPWCFDCTSKPEEKKGNALTKESIIENTYHLKISPTPSLPKRGNPSLWKREVRRDFIKKMSLLL